VQLLGKAAQVVQDDRVEITGLAIGRGWIRHRC
jgi:hypothetical protein